MSDSVQFQGGCRDVDLVIIPHPVTFHLEHAIDDSDMAPGALGNVLPDVEALSIVHGVLVPVGHELSRNAEGEVRIVELNVEKSLEHGVSFLSLDAV